jgi:predicted metal-dependent phosphoesterase TrpH
LYSDLHIHSNVSDGVLSPADIVKQASNCDLDYIAIADHDSVDGIEEAVEAGYKLSVNVIPAVEFSCVTEDEGREVHILGYLHDYTNRTLRSLLKHFSNMRKKRIMRMAELLEKNGITIDYNELYDIAGSGTIGRPHLAKAIVGSGGAGSVNEAFYKYLIEGKPAYVPKSRFGVEGAVTVIHKSRGLAVWAHPEKPLLNKYIKRYNTGGLDGIEVYHPKFTPKDSRNIAKVSRREGMLITGGSDWHSSNRNGEFGSYLVETEKLGNFLDVYFNIS